MFLRSRFRNALIYDRMFKEIHRLTLQLGIETNSTKTRGTTGKRYGYLKDRGKPLSNYL